MFFIILNYALIKNTSHVSQVVMLIETFSDPTLSYQLYQLTGFKNTITGQQILELIIEDFKIHNGRGNILQRPLYLKYWL